MNEQLQQEIQDLQTQAGIFANDLARIAGDDAQKSTYDALTAELATVNDKITAKQAQLSEVQTAVQTNQSAMSDSLTQIDLGDGETASIYDYTTTTEAADLLMAYINEKIAEITAQATIQGQAYKQELDAATQKIADAESRASAAEAESSQKDLTISDLESKRDAAATQLTEKDEEIARLSKENADLRDNVVKPAATNITANLKELADKAKAARPKIYNLRWKDESNHNKYLANDAVTGDEIEFGYLNLGKYNVITEAEALQFRNEQPAAATTETTEAEPMEENPVSDTTLDNGVEPPSEPFQETEVSNVDDAVSGEPTAGTVETEARSVEQRLSALEAAVFGK